MVNAVFLFKCFKTKGIARDPNKSANPEKNEFIQILNFKASRPKAVP